MSADETTTTAEGSDPVASPDHPVSTPDDTPPVAETKAETPEVQPAASSAPPDTPPKSEPLKASGTATVADWTAQRWAWLNSAYGNGEPVAIYPDGAEPIPFPRELSEQLSGLFGPLRAMQAPRMDEVDAWTVLAEHVFVFARALFASAPGVPDQVLNHKLHSLASLSSYPQLLGDLSRRFAAQAEKVADAPPIRILADVGTGEHTRLLAQFGLTLDDTLPLVVLILTARRAQLAQAETASEPSQG